ncbi:MAG: I78 family peptidase inhibitor [Hyphomonadaceae bacterium]|nr:I78 family peptidase inhibitor [Hyphomonadaceae bacterium]
MKAMVSACALALVAACSTGLLPPLQQETAAPADDVAPAPVTPNPASGAEDTCNAAAFAALVGQPESAIDRAALPAGARVIAPNSMVTQDYRPDRLNIYVSTTGRVSSMRCG